MSAERDTSMRPFEPPEPGTAEAPFDPDQVRARDAMLREIAEEVAGTASWLGRSKLSPAVMAAMAAVPRHSFVPERFRAHAYANRPLPIGDGQTISQPYMVAVMTELAEVAPDDKVLEVGTGCGYQAAVLARLAARVFSIETLPALAEAAAERLRRLGCSNVTVRCGDGSLGCPEEAPFDAILVTAAAARRVPPALVAQLAPGGRLVIPVQRGGGSAGGGLRGWFGLAPEQELLCLSKDPDGRVQEKAVLPVAFVPLVERPPPDRP